MGRVRFVEPELVRLPLSDGDWIDVKKILTTGEQRRMFADMRRRFAPGELPSVDPAQVALARAVAYIVMWSFVDRHGQPVPVSPGAIDQLDTWTFTEIREAIDAHERAQDQAFDDEKKTRSSTTTSATFLQSVG
jgi:hypothetical protein